MEDEKKLYPLGFCPVEEKHEWGTEEFHIADLGFKDSFVRDGWLATNTVGDVMETFLDRMVGENCFDYYGIQFPFQVKWLRMENGFPLTVCPDDETAEQRFDTLGKDKIWYIESASPDARLEIGFSRDTSAGEVYEKAEEGSLEELMREIPAVPGEFVKIPADIVHGAKGRMRILEISESSPIDFRMSGESLCEAMDFINYGKYDGPKDEFPFKVKAVRLDKEEKVETEGLDSCICYTCIKGGASVVCSVQGIGNTEFGIKEGETIVIPAEISDFAVKPVGTGTLLIETLPARRNVQDKLFS